MNYVVVIVGLIICFALKALQALMIEEIRGRIERHACASVERAIASMPPQLQALRANKWRAEFATLESMPLSAIAFARRLQQRASRLAATLEQPALDKVGRTSARQMDYGRSLRGLIALLGLAGSAQAKLVGSYTKFALKPRTEPGRV